MKRGFWTGMAAALMASMAGCVKNDTSPGDSALPGAINFGVSTESRTVINTAADMTEFSVWAYRYDDTDTPNEVFSSEYVKRNTEGQWEYEPLQQWQVGYYVFGAFYPEPTSLDERLKVQMIIQKNGEKAGGIAVERFECKEGKDDLLVALYERDYNGTNSEAVELDFKHLLSKVSVEARAVGTEEGVNVRSVEFTGMAMVGTYKYENKTYDPDGAWSEWRGEGAEIGTFTIGSVVTLPANGEVTPLLTDLLLIPQSVTESFKVTLTYQIGDETETRTAEATLPTQPAWEEGKAYRYTLTVRGDYIVFDTPTVSEWDEAVGGNVIIDVTKPNS